MHSKQKGNIGEARIAADLMENGFSVFSEMGDLSRIDLIAEKDTRLFRIQVKAITENAGKVVLSNRKSGPGYKFKYSETDVDIFAVYVLGTDKIAYVSGKELCEMDAGITLRLEPAKNGQTKGVNLFSEFTLDKLF